MPKVMPLPDDLRPLAEELGGMIMLWNNLEFQLAALIVRMLGIKNNDVAQSLLGNIKHKDRCKIAKAVGFTVKPNDRWYERLEEIVNEIENPLNSERNRMVHDLWSRADIVGTMNRMNMTGKVMKNPPRLKFDSHPISLQKVVDFSLKINQYTAFLISLNQGLLVLPRSSPSKREKQPPPQGLP